MARSEKHIADINKLTEELGLDKMAGLDDMGNAELAEIAKGLRAQKKAKETEGDQVDEGDQGDTDAPKPEGPVVAKGKSLTTLKGTLGEGSAIGPEMLAGGEDSFKELKKKGYIEG